MDNNKDFLSRIVSDKARFYLFDFHVHSPASYDVRIGKNFQNLSPEEKIILKDIPENLSKNPVEYESVILKKFPVEKYYNLLVEHRNNIAKQEEISEGEDWVFIAITDHNICTYASALSKYAWKHENLKSNRLIVFPGIELDVSFIEPKSGNNINIHIVLIYTPQTEPHEIFSSIKDASNQHWQFGNSIFVEDLPNFIRGIRNHREYPAIAIAAHINSSKGIREETKKCILNYIDTAILRTQAELNDAEDTNRIAELSEKLTRLIEKKDNEDGLSFDILNMLGKCGFDALQVRGKKDEPYYYQIHRYKKELGRAVAVTCSDSHTIKNIFICKGEEGCSDTMSYIKINDISTSISPQNLFKKIRDKGLRYGETRVSFTKPDKIPYWIEGIEITLDAEDGSKFWVGNPSNALNNKENTNIKCKFVLPFSRNLNCIIGGRGSGKSASIESISFLMENNQFLNTNNMKSDWYKRAKATLKGCKVSICWRILGEKSLPKSALFIKGYFDMNNKHLPITYSNIDDKEILHSSVTIPKVDIFRIHDIEEAANPDKLRTLFDSICGEEVQTLSDEISSIINELEIQRKDLGVIANKIIDITNDNSPLREYARRKYEFDRVNNEEIKNQYEKIDQASSALTIADKSLTYWSRLIEKFDLDSRRKSIQNLVNQIKNNIYVKNANKNELKPYCNEFVELLKKIDNDDLIKKANVININRYIDKLEESLINISEEIYGIKTNISNIIKTAHEDLVKQGILQGSNDRQAKKEAYEESQNKLNEYIDYYKQFNDLLNKRKTIYTRLKSKCEKRSELRKKTAEHINRMLLRNLDSSIIQIEADAQPMEDKEKFKKWFEERFDWTGCKYKESRLQAILEKKDTIPETLKGMLISPNENNIISLIIDKPSASVGKIDEDAAIVLINNNRACIKLDPEILKETYSTDFFKSLPKEIQDGLCTFNSKDNGKNKLLLDSILELDEIVLDDIPVVRLNDRPKEAKLKKELIKLSPGQRCSAILPILLLTGNNPLIIDQPEDNLDNRLIRQVIVNVLASIKLNRQVIIATHNANLPVLGDAEQIIALRAIDEDMCELEVVGSLDNSQVVKNITDIMEGGREAFQFRQTIYQSYWEEGAELSK